MFLRKRPLDNKKNSVMKKPKFTVKSDLFSQLFFPVLHGFLPALPIHDFILFCKTNKYLASYTKNNMVWRNMYRVHFGEPFFAGDYRSQYIAEHLRIAALKTDNKVGAENKLLAHLQTLPDASWTLYYYAHISEVITPKKPVQYGLESLQAGDLRAIDFLINYFHQKNVRTQNIPEEELKLFLQLLQQQNPNRIIAKHICEVHCIMYNNLAFDEVDQRSALKQKSLELFFELIDPMDNDIDEFLKLFMLVFKKLDFISPFLALTFTINKNIKNEKSILEGIFTYITSNRQTPAPLKLILNNFMKQWAEKGNFLSSFFYAENIRTLLTIYLTTGSQSPAMLDEKLQDAKYFYLKAINGSEYRAIHGLRLLAHLFPTKKLISQSELEVMLKKAVTKGDTQSQLILAYEYRQQRNWFCDSYKVWTIQSASCLELNKQNDNYNFLIRHSSNPRTALYANCALTFIFAQSNNSQAKECFAFVKSIAPSFIENYLSAGLKFGLATEEHRNLVAAYEAIFNEKIGAHQSRGYHLR